VDFCPFARENRVQKMRQDGSAEFIRSSLDFKGVTHVKQHTPSYPPAPHPLRRPARSPPAPRGMLHPKHGRIRAQGRVQQGRSA